MREILFVIGAGVLMSLLIVGLIWFRHQFVLNDKSYNSYYKRFNNRNINVTLFDIILKKNMKRLSK